MWHVGIDLHRLTVVIAAVNDEGNASEVRRINCQDRQAILETMRALQPFRAVIEATGTYRWLYALLSKIVNREKNEAKAFLQQVIQKVAQENPALNAQRSMLEKDLNNIKADKKRLEKDDDKGNNRREIDQDDEKIKQIEGDLSPIIKKLRANDAALNAADQSVRRLSKTEEDLSAKHRELERKLEKPVPDKDSTTSALEQKQKSVVTYVGLNLPRERLRILDSFRDHQLAHKDD